MKIEKVKKTNSKYLVSIVVPIFNMQDKLGNLFKWLPEASGLGIQVILVINNCTDNTSGQLLEFIKFNQLAHTQLVECVTPGPGLARDFGSKYCEGEFTIFWDSDDIGYPKEVDEILRQGTEFDLLITAFDSEPTIETRPQNNDIQREEALFKFLLKPGLWRCIIRSSIIKEISFGKSKMGEDQVFLARLLSKNPNIKFHSKVTYKYFRDLPDQLTSQRKSLQELGTSISEVATLLREKPIKSESLLATIYIKLCMSGIKRGNFKIKLDNLLKLLSFLFSTDYAFLPSRLRCGLVVKILRGDAHA